MSVTVAVIEESMRGEAVNPRYAFVSPKRPITRFYPLLLSYFTTLSYLNTGNSWIAKTKSPMEYSSLAKNAKSSSSNILAAYSLDMIVRSRFPYTLSDNIYTLHI